MFSRSLLLARLALLALAWGAAPRAEAASHLGDAARASDIVAEATVAGPADEFGLTPMTLGRAARRPEGLGGSLLVRLPSPAPEGTAFLLFLVPDELARSLGAWTPVDPHAGIVPLDGRAGAPADLLALADLAVDPPADPAALGERLAFLIGRGEAATAFALEELLDRPELLRRHAPRAVPELRTLLLTRRVSPPTAALAVRALGEVGERGDDVRVIDVVASGAPDVIVEAAADAMTGLANAATAEHLEHALGAAPALAMPGLLRLAGPARAFSLSAQLCEHAGSSRQPVRLAALSSLADLRATTCLPSLRALVAHEDALTSRAAGLALEAASLPPEAAGLAPGAGPGGASLEPGIAR